MWGLEAKPLSLVIPEAVRQPYFISIMKGTNNCNLLTLKELRNSLGLSQAALAKAIGVRRATISDWERGVYSPTLTIEQIQILEELLKRVGLTFNDLPTDISNRF